MQFCIPILAQASNLNNTVLQVIKDWRWEGLGTVWEQG